MFKGLFWKNPGVFFLWEAEEGQRSSYLLQPVQPANLQADLIGALSVLTLPSLLTGALATILSQLVGHAGKDNQISKWCVLEWEEEIEIIDKSVN